MTCARKNRLLAIFCVKYWENCAKMFNFSYRYLIGIMSGFCPMQHLCKMFNFSFLQITGNISIRPRLNTDETSIKYRVRILFLSSHVKVNKAENDFWLISGLVTFKFGQFDLTKHIIMLVIPFIA